MFGHLPHVTHGPKKIDKETRKTTDGRFKQVNPRCQSQLAAQPRIFSALKDRAVEERWWSKSNTLHAHTGWPHRKPANPQTMGSSKNQTIRVWKEPPKLHVWPAGVRITHAGPKAQKNRPPLAQTRRHTAQDQVNSTYRATLAKKPVNTENDSIIGLDS